MGLGGLIRMQLVKDLLKKHAAQTVEARVVSRPAAPDAAAAATAPAAATPAAAAPAAANDANNASSAAAAAAPAAARKMLQADGVSLLSYRDAGDWLRKLGLKLPNTTQKRHEKLNIHFSSKPPGHTEEL